MIGPPSGILHIYNASIKGLKGKNLQLSTDLEALSHATAGFLGYRSKVALIADEFPVEDANAVLYCQQSLPQMIKNVSRQSDNPLKQLSPIWLADLIHAGLTPACDNCSGKHSRMCPIADAVHASLDGHDPVEWICPDCMDSEKYGHCIFCGDELTYRLSDLNEQSECDIHTGESAMSPEEEDGWDRWLFGWAVYESFYGGILIERFNSNNSKHRTSTVWTKAY
jgi:hypothetical protein